MGLRITTLSENTAGQGGFLAEWGLSILIETDIVNILLDTGRSISTTYNADTLGVDLSKIDKIVLSHGHADHTGGLREVLRRVKKKEIEIMPILMYGRSGIIAALGKRIDFTTYPSNTKR